MSNSRIDSDVSQFLGLTFYLICERAFALMSVFWNGFVEDVCNINVYPVVVCETKQQWRIL